MPEIPSNITDLVGRTPIVKLTRLGTDSGVELFAKVEAFNPGGSVKDRIGVAMIEAAEREGRIEPGRTTIVEATSGNTGIALAFVCAAKGYDLILTLPQGMSREREALLRLYGASVEMVESLGGMTEAVEAARALAARDDVFLPDQFSNPANPDIHRRTTGPELWDSLDGRVCSFCRRRRHRRPIPGGEVLKERNLGCRIVAVEPRTRRCSAVFRPKIQGTLGSSRPCSTGNCLTGGPVDDEDAIETARALVAARRAGRHLMRAAVWAALQIAARPEFRSARIATILPDSGERYVSTPFFAP
jgi:cysteine synthase A